MNYISYCLYGDAPRYITGMIVNAGLAKKIYPEWTVLVHCGQDMNPAVIEKLKALGADVRIESGPFGHWRKCWRWLPLQWMYPKDRVIFRDADSRLSLRDRQTVYEWIESGYDMHCIRDNPAHHGILGGMWGIKGVELGWRVMKRLDKWPYYLYDYPHDSRFLDDCFRDCDHAILQHDSCTGFRYDKSRPFPNPWQDWPLFIGQIVDVDVDGKETPRESPEEYQIRHQYLYRELLRTQHEPGLNMKDRWNYKGLGKVSYGHKESYTLAGQWFDEVGGTLEDWGCGCAAAKEYVHKCSYTGLEGSHNEYADKCDVDLRDYTSDVDCILLRDVLDHNVEWKKVLKNALSSFRKRMVIVIFRALGSETKIVFVNTDNKYPGVPDLQFSESDLMEFISPFLIKKQDVSGETMFFLQKP